MIVYSVIQQSRGSILYLRRVDQLEGHPIPGTENASQALFSPDGRWVEYEINNLDLKVRLDGSAPVRITEGSANNGADWTTTDELVVGASVKSHGLSRVSVAGGDLTPFTVPDSSRGEIDHIWPIGTPDGKAVVFAIWHGALTNSELAMVPLEGGPVTRLGLKGIRPLAIVDGALVYLVADGAVMAVPLDLSHRRVVGKAVPVLDPVPVVAAFNGNSSVFVSRGGALITGLRAHRSQLVWLGRDGTTHGISGELRDFVFPRLSPDGRQILVMVTDGPNTDAWIDDLETGTLSRLTSSGNINLAQWSRDGKSVTYMAPVSGSKWALYQQSAGGGTKPKALVEVPFLTPVADLAPDGRSALLSTLADQSWDIQRVSLDSNRAVEPYQATRGTDVDPLISPNGRWAALVSDESGTVEVYVRSYPDPSVKVQVSVGGGYGAVWSADGSRLYYATGSVVVEAKVATTPGFRVLSRDTAFRQVPNTFTTGVASYDVSRDGSRIVVPSTRYSAYPLVVVPNWRTELRERLAANRR
jgi:hypothetical protein